MLRLVFDVVYVLQDVPQHVIYRFQFNRNVKLKITLHVVKTGVLRSNGENVTAWPYESAHTHGESKSNPIQFLPISQKELTILKYNFTHLLSIFIYVSMPNNV